MLRAQVQRHGCRRRVGSRGDVAGVGPLPRGERLLDPGEPPGGVGEALQVLGGQAGRVEGPVRRVGLGPRPAPDGGAGTVEVGGPLGHALNLAVFLVLYLLESTSDATLIFYGASMWLRWPEFGLHLAQTGTIDLTAVMRPPLLRPEILFLGSSRDFSGSAPGVSSSRVR